MCYCCKGFELDQHYNLYTKTAVCQNLMWERGEPKEAKIILYNSPCNTIFKKEAHWTSGYI